MLTLLVLQEFVSEAGADEFEHLYESYLERVRAFTATRATRRGGQSAFGGQGKGGRQV